jgi:hypothetical protein
VIFLTGGDPRDDANNMRMFHPRCKLMLVTEGGEGCRYYTQVCTVVLETQLFLSLGSPSGVLLTCFHNILTTRNQLILDFEECLAFTFLSLIRTNRFLGILLRSRVILIMSYFFLCAEGFKMVMYWLSYV